MTQAAIQLNDLLEGMVTAPLPNMSLANISLDSRKIKRGDIFVALRGESRDGTAFIDSAINNGAEAVLVDASTQLPASAYDVPVIKLENLKQKLATLGDRVYANPSAQLTLIAVTGTNGKTTCAHLIAQALKLLSVSSAIIGTAGQGPINKLEDSNLTTPDVFELRQLLAGFVQLDVEAVAFEASSHGLEQGRLDALELDVAVFTNLSHDHLDYHEDLTAYANAKLKLFQLPGLGNAVMNADEPLVDDFASQTTAQQIWLYGESQKADVRLIQVKTLVDGLQVTVETRQGRYTFESRLIGRINVENLLAVFTTLLAYGFDETSITRVLPDLVSVPGRMEIFGGDHDLPMVIVDYAHTPDALEKALLSIKDHAQRQLICVFGCGGDRDKDKRPKMGLVAQQHSDICVITDDNPRHESSADIIAGIVAGMNCSESGNDTRIISDRPEAIKWAIAKADCQDIVLIAGKGHEATQQIGSTYVPMSDRMLVGQALEDLQ